MRSAWRIVQRKYAEDAFSGEGRAKYGGRGIHTLDDFAKSLNDGVAQPGQQPGTTDIIRRGRTKVVLNAAREFVTYAHLRTGEA